MAAIAFEHVSKRFGSNAVAIHDFTLTVHEGEFLILVGPSGCGKTTLLRMVAGLEEVTSGQIRIGDRFINDLPPTERDVAMVFQNYALYPHMSVYDNLAFPLRQKKVKKPQARERVNEVAQLLGINELLQRKPGALSGGQRQRVAIGRALVREPRAFLMDEPLSNLDAKLRVQMRAELINLHQRLGITTLYVTHDQTEAMTLGERAVVLRNGLIQQIDTPERLYRHPTNTFVAGFIGSPAMNFLQGNLADGTLELGPIKLELSENVKRNLVRQSGEVIVGVRPEDLHPAPNSAATAFPAEIQLTEQLGPETLAHLRAPALQLAHLGTRATENQDSQTADLSDTLVARFSPDTEARAGQRLQLTINPDRVQFFEPTSGNSLSAHQGTPNAYRSADTRA